MSKNHIPSYLLVLACLAISVSCRKHDIKNVDVRVPQMKNTACARVIQEAFKPLPPSAIRSMDFDVEHRKINVVYDSMIIAKKNIEFVIAGAGFDAFATEDGTQADPEAYAALPPECRE